MMELPKWAIARAKAYARTYSPKILVLGDSMVRGAGSRDQDRIDNQEMAFPAQLARLLTARGLPASWGNMVGDGASTATSGVPYSAYDPRCVLGAGWAASPLQTAGGMGWTNKTTTNALSFTPEEPFDTIIVQYATNAGLDTFAVDVDGFAVATINANAAPSTVQSAAIKVTVGLHQVSVRRTGVGTGCFINGISCYQHNANVCEVQVLNAGMSGGSTGTLLATGLTATHPTWGRDKSYLRWAPDLTIVLVGYNDAHGGVPVSTFTKNLQTLVTGIKTGDMIFIVMPPQYAADIPLVKQVQFWEATRNVAATNSKLCIDLPARWGPKAGCKDFYLNIHPNGAGYGDIAHVLAGVLLS